MLIDVGSLLPLWAALFSEKEEEEGKDGEEGKEEGGRRRGRRRGANDEVERKTCLSLKGVTGIKMVNIIKKHYKQVKISIFLKRQLKEPKQASIRSLLSTLDFKFLLPRLPHSDGQTITWNVSHISPWS